MPPPEAAGDHFRIKFFRALIRMGGIASFQFSVRVQHRLGSLQAQTGLKTELDLTHEERVCPPGCQSRIAKSRASSIKGTICPAFPAKLPYSKNIAKAFVAFH
jgi:hypothetical protein